MKANALIVNWHDSNAPIYSAHFEPNGKRLATGGGDTNVRLWRIDSEGDERKVEYLSTLSKHTQAVNVVRFAPKGEVLASAGDDGNVLLWTPAESNNPQGVFGDAGLEDKETWRVKHMCRSSGAEIYDLAWSPDSIYFIIGSMDNIARIYNAQTGQLVRQIAEHSHYVQGVAWDPQNEYVATQSSDRSVHIYSLRTKDGHFTLEQPPPRVANHAKMDFPGRRISSNSPAPPDFGLRPQMSNESSNLVVGSPVPSAPGTPTVQALPMNPPSVISHSRRSSFGSSPSMRRSASPAPSMPLPAVMPMEASPKPHLGLGLRNGNLYANETLTSFFRRLTFTTDGSLLLTPAGQYSASVPGQGESGKPSYEVINTVYIYTRGGINKPPIAHLPGHKKPSVVVKCSPIYYTIRRGSISTKHITIDTSAEEDVPSLPEPAIAPKGSPALSVMDPPPLLSTTSDSAISEATPKSPGAETDSDSAGPQMAFSLPYRMIYAVATQDSVLLYDTQQHTPICVVSNLHHATFTDLTWSNDGLTLLMTSSDGFCSTLTFSSEELGHAYVPDPANKPTFIIQTTSLSSANTPVPTPTSSHAPPFPTTAHHRTTSNPFSVAASPPPTGMMRPSSPTRSNSTSSIATQSSFAPHASATNAVINNPTLVSGVVPSITAATSSFATSLSMTTPPQTPHSEASSVSGVKRDAGGISEGEKEEVKPNKKRRIAPTPVG